MTLAGKKKILWRGIKRALPLVVLSCLLIAAQAGAEAISDNEDGEKRLSPHNSMKQESCAVCHASEGGPLLSRDHVTTCIQCHHEMVENHPVTRHPLRKKTKIKTPPYLPLTEDGEMVCSTCHEPHGKVKNPKMLRVEFFKLCAACHVGY